MRVLNDGVTGGLRVRPEELAAVENRERTILDERLARFRTGRAPTPLAGRTAVIVDDGVESPDGVPDGPRPGCDPRRARGASPRPSRFPVSSATTT